MGSLARLRYSSKNLALPWHWAKSLCKMWQDNAFVLVYFRVDKLLVLTKIKIKTWKVPKTNICTCKSTKILQYSVSLHFLLNQTFFSLIWCTKPKNTHKIPVGRTRLWPGRISKKRIFGTRQWRIRISVCIYLTRNSALRVTKYSPTTNWDSNCYYYY